MRDWSEEPDYDPKAEREQRDREESERREHLAAVQTLVRLGYSYDGKAWNAPDVAPSQKPRMECRLRMRYCQCGPFFAGECVNKVPVGGTDGVPAVQRCASYQCKAGQRDGILCADGECDRESGVRPVGGKGES